MSTHDRTLQARFTVHGDGRHRGDDGFSGELAGMTLYVGRALDQIDQILGVGELSSFRATGGPQELEAEVGHQDDFGLEIVGRLSRTSLAAHRPEARPVAAPPPGNELDSVLDHVTRVPLVAGCFIVSLNGNLTAHRVPGVDEEALSGTGRRMKVAHDAFDRFLGTPSLVTTFAWAQLLAAPVGNGLAVVIADLTCAPDAVFSAVHAGGGALSGVDLRTLRSSTVTDQRPPGRPIGGVV